MEKYHPGLLTPGLWVLSLCAVDKNTPHRGEIIFIIKESNHGFETTQ